MALKFPFHIDGASDNTMAKLMFGVEYEFAYDSDHDKAVSLIPSSIANNRCQLVSDGSIKPYGKELVIGTYTTEFNTWPKGDGAQNFVRDMRKILEAVKDIGGYANSSCGFHVHVSRADGVDDNEHFLGIRLLDPIITSFNRNMKATWWARRDSHVKRDEHSGSHYAAVNIRSYSYAHLEFRMGNGCNNLRGIMHTVYRAMKMHNSIMAMWKQKCKEYQAKKLKEESNNAQLIFPIGDTNTIELPSRGQELPNNWTPGRIVGINTVPSVNVIYNVGPNGCSYLT